MNEGTVESGQGLSYIIYFNQTKDNN